jgi:hypothetical protein
MKVSRHIRRSRGGKKTVVMAHTKKKHVGARHKMTGSELTAYRKYTKRAAQYSSKGADTHRQA